MKGLTVTFECQLCGKKVEKATAYEIGSTLQMPKGWVGRKKELRAEIAKLYPGWDGAQGPDVLPRLFCSQDHLGAFEKVEGLSAEAASKEALKIAQVKFAALIRPAKLRAMDAVTALATAVQDKEPDA